MKYTVKITDEYRINIIRALRVAAKVSNDAAQLNKRIPNMERIMLQRASDYKKGLADMFSSIICNDEE